MEINSEAALVAVVPRSPQGTTKLCVRCSIAAASPGTIRTEAGRIDEAVTKLRCTDCGVWWFSLPTTEDQALRLFM